jgi:hypothetical protein
MPQMDCDVVPQLEHGTEERAADDDGRQQTRRGEERKRGQWDGKRRELREWPLFGITEEARRGAED